MSGPSWRKTPLDCAAAPRNCSRSKLPTAGMSRSMMNLRNVMLTSLTWCSPPTDPAKLALLGRYGEVLVTVGWERYAALLGPVGGSQQQPPAPSSGPVQE